jgi:hypothetical protein
VVRPARVVHYEDLVARGGVQGVAARVDVPCASGSLPMANARYHRHSGISYTRVWRWICLLSFGGKQGAACPGEVINVHTPDVRCIPRVVSNTTGRSTDRSFALTVFAGWALG